MSEPDSFYVPVLQRQVLIQDWQQHRFGLSAGRWQRLSGQSFWITGAGTGYGQCIALALAAANATVFITGRREHKLMETVSAAGRLGITATNLIPMPADITNAEQVASVAAEIGKSRTPFMGLVNNAGLPQPGGSVAPLLNSEFDTMATLIATNITAQWTVTKHALPVMFKHHAGRVVFITSEAGWAFTPGFGIYNMTKAALNNLAGSFAAECANQCPEADIQINTLVPGEARTEMNQGSLNSPYAVVPMTLTLLSQPAQGPNGCYFHRDGRHLDFTYASPYPHSLYQEMGNDDEKRSDVAEKPAKKSWSQLLSKTYFSRKSGQSSQ